MTQLSEAHAFRQFLGQKTISTSHATSGGQGLPQNVQASRHHDALFFYPDASVSAVTL